MKVLKILVVFLISLSLIYIVVSAIAPSNLIIEKSITINTSAEAIVENVVCSDKWTAWSSWQAMDPEMKNEYSENPCGPESWNSRNGPNSGKGTQTIEEVNGTGSIQINIVFEGFEGVNYANWRFVEIDGLTTVTWNFEGVASPFFFRPMNLMMKGVLEHSYESGLASLKAVVEANSTAAGE